jgi:flavodoxin
MVNTRILVVYYSSSGNTKKVSDALAEQLEADLERIQPETLVEVDIKGKGMQNFLNMGRAVFGGMTKREAVIAEASYDPADYDLVVVGTPVYANTLPAPVRAYLTAHGADFSRVAYFCTGEDPNNAHIFELMAEASGRDPVARYPFHAPDVRNDAFAPALTAYVQALDAG